MRTPSRQLLPLFGLMVGLGASAPAHAFSEDVCVIDGVVSDCMTTVCKGGSDASTSCQANAVWQGGMATASTDPKRSMVHVDATYFLAVALGYRADVAYWVATYDEVVDQGGYMPMNASGKWVPDGTNPSKTCDILRAATVNGFYRTGFGWGGSAYHFVTMYSPASDGSDLNAVYSGLYPYTNKKTCTGNWSTCTYDPTEHVFEGMIAGLRRWAFGGTLGCINSFTVQNTSDSNSWFTGSQCLQTTVTQPMPLFTGITAEPPIVFQSGPLPLEVKVTGNGPTDWSVLYTYDKLQGILDGTLAQQDGSKATGRLWLDGKAAGAHAAVPAELAKLGFYLHVLQDVPSHSYCGDEQSGGANPGSYISGNASGMRYTYNLDRCTQNLHASIHLEEIGQGTTAGLPLRDYTALAVTYRELAAFKQQFATAHPEWFVTLPKTYTEAQLVGTAATTVVNGTSTGRYVPGLVARPLMTKGASARVTDMMNAMTQEGLTPLPGLGSNAQCPL